MSGLPSSYRLDKLKFHCVKSKTNADTDSNTNTNTNTNINTKIIYEKKVVDTIFNNNGNTYSIDIGFDISLNFKKDSGNFFSIINNSENDLYLILNANHQSKIVMISTNNTYDDFKTSVGGVNYLNDSANLKIYNNLGSVIDINLLVEFQDGTTYVSILIHTK